MSGSVLDFTLGPQNTETIDITAPEACVTGGGHRVLITTRGATALVYKQQATEADRSAPEWLRTDLMPSLVTDGFKIHDNGFAGSCTGGPGVLYVAIADWETADAVARAIGRALLDGDLAGSVELRVKQQVIYCPQPACGD